MTTQETTVTERRYIQMGGYAYSHEQRCAAQGIGGRPGYAAAVEPDGEVLAWDPIGRIWTTVHSIPAAQQAYIRRHARTQAEIDRTSIGDVWPAR